jgi:elongation factor 1 alpha-like protein
MHSRDLFDFHFRPPDRVVQKPFRLSISDIFKAQSTTGITVSGRIESGYVQKDDRVLVMPLNEVATVKSVALGEGAASVLNAFAGDHVCLSLVGLADSNSLATGMVACDPAAPIPVTKKIKARIVVFNIEVPITKGFPVVFHYGSVQSPAVIKKLLAVVNKSTGEVTKKKPRCLTRNCNALVEIAIDAPVCIEEYAESKELGRFMLRVGGKTIAAGLVTGLN